MSIKEKIKNNLNENIYYPQEKIPPAVTNRLKILKSELSSLTDENIKKYCERYYRSGSGIMEITDRLIKIVKSMKSKE